MTSNDVRVLRTQKGQTIKNENFSKLDFLKLYLFSLKDAIKNMKDRDFPGGPVVKTPHSQCRGHGFDPWLEN